MTICEESGLCSDLVLAHDAPLPLTLETVFAVATDDLMVFSDSGPGTTLEAAQRVEAAMVLNGIQKNPDKDVDDVLSTTCVGVDLVEGTRWCPPTERSWLLLNGVLGRGCGLRWRCAVVRYVAEVTS